MRGSSAIGISQARRIALAAQRFGDASSGTNGRRAVLAMVRRLGLLQIDSVNVLVRSQYLPLFSRLGAYDRKLLDDLAYGTPRRLFEYWGHEASLLPLEHYPLLRWRMDRARSKGSVWSAMGRIAREQPRLLATIEATIRDRGPMSASDFEGSRGTGSWWGWSDVKHGVEFLFAAGVLSVRSRRPSFERVYDLAERIVPRALMSRSIDAADAQRELMRIASRALGIATERDLRDYFRLSPNDSKARLAELVESGDVIPVAVEGWTIPAYLDAKRTMPRQIIASALLSPFDPVVWNRPRAQRLFGFTYRLEIYTPSHKRTYGYYVLPYLVDGALAARVDLKAERTAGALRVHAVHFEGRVDRAAVEERLRADLRRLADWLSLERVLFS